MSFCENNDDAYAYDLAHHTSTLNIFQTNLISFCYNGQPPFHPTQHILSFSGLLQGEFKSSRSPSHTNRQLSEYLQDPTTPLHCISRLTLTHHKVKCQPFYMTTIYVLGISQIILQTYISILPNYKSLILERSSTCCKHKYTNY